MQQQQQQHALPTQGQQPYHTADQVPHAVYQQIPPPTTTHMLQGQPQQQPMYQPGFMPQQHQYVVVQQQGVVNGTKQSVQYTQQQQPYMYPTHHSQFQVPQFTPMPQGGIQIQVEHQHHSYSPAYPPQSQITQLHAGANPVQQQVVHSGMQVPTSTPRSTTPTPSTSSGQLEKKSSFTINEDDNIGLGFCSSSSAQVVDAQEIAEKMAHAHLMNERRTAFPESGDNNFADLDRKERNRMSARKSRLRKKYFLDALIQKVESLEGSLLEAQNTIKRLSNTATMPSGVQRAVPISEKTEPANIPNQNSTFEYQKSPNGNVAHNFAISSRKRESKNTSNEVMKPKREKLTDTALTTTTTS